MILQKKDKDERTIACVCPSCKKQTNKCEFNSRYYNTGWSFQNSYLFKYYNKRCEFCNNHYVIVQLSEKEDYTVINPNEYTSLYISSVEITDLTTTEQKELNITCSYSNEKIIPKTNGIRRYNDFKQLGYLLFGTEKRDVYKPMEFIIVKNKYVNKIPKCCYCETITTPNNKLNLNTYYTDNNEKNQVCDKCKVKRNIAQPFFGFKFRPLNGRGSCDNPFDKLVGIELETVEGDMFGYFDLPEYLQNKLACKYDGSLYSSNYTGEEDDENSPVNSSDYEQDDEHDDRGNGREFILIPLAKNKLFKTIDETTEFLKSKKLKINKSCGFHCHFDMKNETYHTVRKTFLAYSLFEDTLFNMLPITRRKSRYCMPLKKNYFDFFNIPSTDEKNKFERYWYGTNNQREIENRKKHKYEESRYVSINYHALFFHGTLENRIHSGTLNADKIKKWVLINQIIIDFAKNTTMKRLMKMSGTQENLFQVIYEYEKKYPQLKKYKLVEYIGLRTDKFKSKKKSKLKPIKIMRDIKPTKIETDVIALENMRVMLNK